MRLNVQCRQHNPYTSFRLRIFMRKGEHMTKRMFSAITLCVLTLLLPLAQASLIDDGYHFQNYQSSPAVADYIEWWFFSFSQPNIQGIVQYALWDPANLTNRSMGTVLVNLYYNDSSLQLYYMAPWQTIVTSETSANLAIGPDTITVQEDGGYNLQGVAGDLQGNIVMYDLYFYQDTTSLNGFRNMKMSRFDPNQEMNWYVQMPSTQVFGALMINGELVPINARGYHDHNWGTWKLTCGMWNWFQTNEPGLAIVGYDFFTLHKGQISVIVDGKEISFNKRQYIIINYDWTLDPETMQRFPRKTMLIAFNGFYLLTLKITVETTALVGMTYEEQHMTWVVFESTVHFKGRLCGPSFNKQIDTVGFREYTINIATP